MGEPDGVPPVLRAIAVLFVFEGLGGVAHLAVDLNAERLHLDPSVLGFWIARGLLRGERTWRAWALVLAIAHTAIIAFVAALMLVPGLPVETTITDVPITDARTALWLTVMAPYGLANAWTWWVLMQPAIRRRFVPDDYEDCPEPVLRV